MKNPTICKSECNTWYVIAFVEAYQDYGVVHESATRKGCADWLKSQAA